MSIFKASNSFKNYSFAKDSIIGKCFRFTAMLLGILVLSVPAKSQESIPGSLEIYSTYGYMFGGYLRTYNGELNIGDDDNYTIGLNYTVAPGTQVEISWMHQESDVTITEYGNIFEYEESFDLNTNYIQIGVLKEAKPGPVRPFGKFTMGTAIYNPRGKTSYDDVWRFAFTMGGGVKAYLNDKVGIRLSGSMMMPVYWSGLSFFCGTGGCSTGVSTGSAILQGEVSAGLFISLGQ